jgi:hypothetical protein
MQTAWTSRKKCGHGHVQMSRLNNNVLVRVNIIVEAVELFWMRARRRGSSYIVEAYAK